MIQKGNDLYQCPECGLHYRDKKTAEDCRAFCKAHNACSFELIQKSIEHQKVVENNHEG